MIAYKKCSEVDLLKVYEAFQAGFSDYIIKMSIPWEQFYSSFFEREGNQLENSFIAFDDEKPVGIIFGGLKYYEGTLTLRCGALCVAPGYRGQGISKKLFELHRQHAIDCGCKQLFLEVIVGNDRAINFYKKMGYEKVYDLKSFSLKNPTKLSNKENYEIKEIDWEQAEEMAANVDTHINWQNGLDYAKKVMGVRNYGIYQDERLLGLLTISERGRIFFLYINPAYRHKGMATALLSHALDSLKMESLHLTIPNNASLEVFARKMGFTQEAISQYEMYLPL